MWYTALEIVAWLAAAFVLGFAVAWALQQLRVSRTVSRLAMSEREAARHSAAATQFRERASIAEQTGLELDRDAEQLREQITELENGHELQAGTIARLTADLDAARSGDRPGVDPAATRDAVARLRSDLEARTEANRTKDRALAQLAADLQTANEQLARHEAESGRLHDELAALADEHDRLGEERDALRRAHQDTATSLDRLRSEVGRMGESHRGITTQLDELRRRLPLPAPTGEPVEPPDPGQD